MIKTVYFLQKLSTHKNPKELGNYTIKKKLLSNKFVIIWPIFYIVISSAPQK